MDGLAVLPLVAEAVQCFSFFLFCYFFYFRISLASCNERFPRRLCEFERSQLFLQRSYFGFAAFRFRSVDLPAMVLALSTHEYQL